MHFRQSLIALMVCACYTSASADRFDVPLGVFGEVPLWLTLDAPRAEMDVDPLAAFGGESQIAAKLGDAIKPAAEQPLAAPSSDAQAAAAAPPWRAVRMISPEIPAIWNEYPRLVVSAETRYAYCRLDSPSDQAANLLSGSSRGPYRIYLNGRDLGTFDGGHAWEFAREIPIELAKGPNHLFVRFTDATLFACRVVGSNAQPLRDIVAVIDAPREEAITTPDTRERRDDQTLAHRIGQIPPLLPPDRPDVLGIRLGRTMALLETGKFTGRPVRIVFSGQSIESGWPEMLINHLRQRYPDTHIIAENRAIGGWFVWRMQKLLKHDILRFQPDLVLFSAYQGQQETWERLLAELRAETTADIIIRTAHIGAHSPKPDTADDVEAISLRRLAAKYEVELIEVRREWLAYLNAHKLEPKALLRDKTHLNADGQTLMAALYDRHFTQNPAATGWADTVRRYDVGRFLIDNKTDQIVLEGEGWRGDRIATSNSADDRLRLKFCGTRLDLVLPIPRGSARVLIDGKKPSELNLFHGTRPQYRTHRNDGVNFPMAYHTGPNMQAETWVLSITHANVDTDPRRANQRVKFTLTGSRTGPDGEGSSDRKFVSNSGRITILTSDWYSEPRPLRDGDSTPEMRPLTPPAQIVWHILPDGLDETPRSDRHAEVVDHYWGQPYDYITIVDGLPYGDHELTLIPIPGPTPSRAFGIVGIDVHRPPLARDANEWTVPPFAPADRSSQ